MERCSLLKNNFCPSQDYDFYTIPFPLKALKKGQKLRFLNGELGKLHPCYSDDCCFDSYLRLEKSGLKADVVVMQKYKLAEYKQQNGHKPVFVKERQKHPFFISNKSFKFSFWFILVFLLFIFLLVFSLMFSGKTVVQDVFTEPVVTVQQEPVVPVTKLLETIKTAGGTITSFSWQTDGFKERVSVQVSGVFPEQLSHDFPEATFSSVSYRDRKPFVSFELNRKMMAAVVSQNRSASVSQNFDMQRVELRDFLSQNKIELIEEGVSPYSLKLNVPSAVYEVFFDFIAGHDEKSICVSSVLVQGRGQNNGAETLRIDLVFSTDFYCDCRQLLSALGKCSALFYVEQSPEQKTVPEKQIINHENKLKVGQILHPDGSVTEFFKDQNGKIFRE